jgi:hypothetical protein
MLCLVVSASPIHKTIDELLKNEEQKSLEIPSYDPFKRAQPLLNKKHTKRPSHRSVKTELIALMDKRAYINGRWYSLGQRLSEGKIIKIDASSVTLKKGNKIKILRLRQHKKLFSISEKDKK